jgi:hypothetical protein
MLDQVKHLHSKCGEFCVPDGRLNDYELIKQRVDRVPGGSQSALRLVLSYLYLVDGPTNLRNPQYRDAEAYLEPYEIVLARYLKTRTNGTGRSAYGKPALHHARSVGYRCECCGFRDVRALNLDHVDGRGKDVFLLLCANCHSIKSRKFDWLGTARVS